jgi:tetratricopeptide (TPR) repeat protein
MTKRVLNHKVVFRMVVGLAGLGLVVHLVHAYQAARLAGTLRGQARQAEEQGQADRAAACLQRYLAFAPDDADALADYGTLLEHGARTHYERGRAAAVFQQVLARQPQRADVRRRLAALVLQLGWTDEARQHLEALLKARPRQADLEGLLGLCLEWSGEAKQAAGAYRQSLGHDPKQIDVAARLARLLGGPLGDPRKAARVLDDMVKAHDGSADAYLERALFRMENGALDDAAADLSRARERAPDDLRVLLAAADLAGRRGRADEARECWRRVRTRSPTHAGAHLALASLEARQGRLREAADCLREGLAAVPDNPDLLTALGEVHIDRGEESAAREVVGRLRGPAGQPARADYLEGLLLVRRSDWARGLPLLEAAVQQGEPALAARAAVAVARCRAQRGDGDWGLAALRQAVALDPSGPVRLALAAALEASGSAPEALEQYRQVALLPDPPDEVWLPLARALIQHTRALPARSQTWAEAEKALDRAARLPAQASAAAVVRAELLEAQGQADQARQVLRKARDARPDEAGPWLALAALSARQGDARGATEVLAAARARLGDHPELRGAELELAPRDGRSVASLRELEKTPPWGGPEEKDRFLCGVAAAWFEASEFAEGKRLCRQLPARPDADLATRVALLEVVLQGGLDDLVGPLVADVRRLEGEDGTWWRCGEAGRLVLRAQRGDRAGLEAAGGLLDETERRRPEWSRVPLMRAWLAELAGEPGRAAVHYRRAFDLGERQVGTVQRLVRLLAEGGRDAEADEVLRRVQQQAVLSGGLARLAAEVALRLHNGEGAAELARQAVPPAGRDYRDQVWLGQVLGLADKSDEAEAALRWAVHLGGDLPDPWAALVAHLARAGRGAEAEEALRAMEKKLPPDQAELALAVCHEALAHAEEADRHYRTALKQRPDDGQVIQRATSFFVRLDRPAQAVPLLRRLLDPAVAVPDGNRRWARRQLALALAFDGDEAKYREARELLQAEPADDPVARRARDFVEAARPQTRADALRRLEASWKAVPPAVDELFRLARLYEAADDGEKARQTMLDVLALGVHNPEYLAHHAGSLLRRGKKDEARPWVVRLEKLEPGSPRVQRFREMLGPVRAAARAPERVGRKQP